MSFVVLTVFVVTAQRRMPNARIIRVVSMVLATLAVVAVWMASGTPLTYAWDILRHMVLPVATLTLISFAGTMLLTRNSMLETMREDFVMAARAKGLPERARARQTCRT